MRQPPTAVPIPMVTAQRRMTQSGMRNSGSTPPSTSARVNTPMNFCPSLLPWLNPMNAAESICRRPKRRRTTARGTRRKIQEIATIIANPPRNPRIDEKPRPMRTLRHPSQRRTPRQAAEGGQGAPDDDGDHRCGDRDGIDGVGADDAFTDGGGHGGAGHGPQDVEPGGHYNGDGRGEDAGGDDGGDGVGGVCPAVNAFGGQHGQEDRNQAGGEREVHRYSFLLRMVLRTLATSSP